MGMRCVTGEKSYKWLRVAEALLLPRPTGDECAEYLAGEALLDWLDLGHRVERVATYPGKCEDTESRVLEMEIKERPLVYVEFMRLIGIMEADRAAWREEYERQHPMPFSSTYEQWVARDKEMDAQYKFVWA